ncbi:MAG: type IV pilus secretin PilQ, partial [Desulfamplus sp.]|nr:type IV pilus secretin PilQ [Desulfamplus sp.]
MSHLLFTGFRIAFRSACFVWCLFVFAGCITSSAQSGKNSADKGTIPPGQILLKSIDLKVNADSIDLLIKGNGKMRYSAVKQDFPLGVMVYLHDVVIDDKFLQPSVPEGIDISSLSVSYVDDTKKAVGIKVLLRENLNYQPQESDSTLTLFFYKNGVQPSFSEVPSIQEANLFTDSEPSETVLSGSNASKQTSQNSPLEKMPMSNTSSSSSDVYRKKALVTGIDFHSGEEGETSIVINTSNPIKYDMQRNEFNNELQLNLYNTDIPEYHQRQLVTTYFNSAVDKIVPVDRTANQAASRIRIVLRERVPYHILQEQNRLTLFLEPSSVKPMKLEGEGLAISGGSSAGPGQPVYNIDGNTQNRPSRQNLEVPQNLQLAGSSQNLGDSQSITSGNSDSDSEPEDLEAMAMQDRASNAQDQDFDTNKDNFFDENPVYTGEEISLDFYETDIKNVFRILQTVSGENFAVDKDVTGTVTLTLEKPAPWDEILDLILKMNGLGKKKEGSIVRIATMQTIKREEDEKAALFAARVQAQEQKKQQEPMFTEYIPINYANAETDIKPHIEKLLTPSRSSSGGTSSSGGNTGGGTLTVDQRTNMIILTDTKGKIEKAKQLIYKLDKVTPQIMISARIVEVSKDFSRDIGVDWGLSSQDVYRDDIGGLYGFDVAMNHPVNASSGIGYTFNRLAGTPLLLDARLTASELTGDTKIISSPKIITLDNKTAKIDQGLEYGYQSGVDENGNPVIAFKPIKLSLEVTPGVTPDQRVKMTLKISKNEVSGTVAGIPSLSTSEANTELLVNDGNTIVIGGIVKSTVSEGRSGFPLLSNIPYLG